jgi:hypothetical protein
MSEPGSPWRTSTCPATGLLLVVIVALPVPSLTAIDRRISAPGPDLALLRQVLFWNNGHSD